MQRGTRFRLISTAVVVAGIGLGAAAFLRAKPAPPPKPAQPEPAFPDPAPPVAVAPAPPPAPPHPPGPDRSPSSSAPPPPPGSEAAAPLNEAVLMARLRSVAGSDFGLAVALARAGNRRFPDSADAPERTSILIHALAAQGQSREARAEAEYAVNHYPDSPWVREIAGFTGAHPHRNLVLTDAGTIQYQ